MQFDDPDLPRLLRCDRCTFTLACVDIHAAIRCALQHAATCPRAEFSIHHLIPREVIRRRRAQQHLQ